MTEVAFLLRFCTSYNHRCSAIKKMKLLSLSKLVVVAFTFLWKVSQAQGAVVDVSKSFSFYIIL